MPAFFKNLSFVVLLNLLVKPAYILGVEVSVQNTVGPEVYGIFFALLNGAYLFQILNDFGLQIFNNRNVARDNTRATELFSELLSLKFILAVCFLGIVLVYGMVAGYRAWLSLLAIISINLILISTLLLVRSSVSGLGLYKADSMLSVLDKSIMIVVCGGMLVTLEDFSIFHFALAQTGSLLVAIIVALLILHRHAVIRIRQPGLHRVKHLVAKAGPYALAVFLMSLYTRIDGVMIEQLADQGAYESGLYAAGYRLLDAATMFAFLFAVLLLPMYASILEQPKALRALMKQGARLMGAFTIGTSAVCFFYQNQIMSFLYDAANDQWSVVFGLLILSLNGLGLMYIFGTFLTARGVMRRLNLTYGVFVLLNFVMNAFLIPRHGALGAAVATLITQSLAGIALCLMSLRMVSLTFTTVVVFRSGIFVVAAVLIAFGSTLLPDPMHWLLKATFAAIGIALLTFITRTITSADLASLRPVRKTDQ